MFCRSIYWNWVLKHSTLIACSFFSKIVSIEKSSFLNEGKKTILIFGSKGKCLWIVVRDYDDILNESL